MKPKSRVCEWKYDDIYGYHETACGENHWFEDEGVFEDGGVSENHYKYCPYCGKPIRVKITEVK